MPKTRRPLQFMLLVFVMCILLQFVGCSREKSQIENFEQLSGKVIVSQNGSMHAANVKECETLADCKNVYAYDNASCVAMLLSGKADAIALDYLMAKSLVSQYDGLLMLEEELGIAKYGIAFMKDNPLRNQFNEVLNQMLADGSLDTIVNYWTSEEEKKPFVQDWEGKNGTLTCQVDASVEPICFYNDEGIIMGLDVDLVCSIAKALDVHVEFIQNDFDDLFTSVMSAQTDFICSGITITDKRQKMVDFTDGYLDASTVLIVRDETVDTTSQSALLSLKNSFNRTFLEENRYLDLLRGYLMTIFLVFSSMLFGLIVGIILFLLDYAGIKIVSAVITKVSSLYILLPLSTWLLICYYLIFPVTSGEGIIAGVFGLGISFAFGVYGGLADALAKVPQGEVEASNAMGFSKVAFLRHILLPQMMPNFLGSMTSAVVYQVRDSSLACFVAVSDLSAMTDAISAKTAEPFLPIIVSAVGYVLFAFLLYTLVRKLKNKLYPRNPSTEQIKKRVLKGMLEC